MKIIRIQLLVLLSATILLNCGGKEEKKKEGFTYEKSSSQENSGTKNVESNVVNIVLTVIKATTTVATSAAIGSMFSPLPIPGLVSSGISAAQNEIEKAKFKADGAQKLIPIQDGLISANITIQLFANALKDFISVLQSFVPMDKPIPIIGPINGEISIAPIITAVELVFKPILAIMMENIKIQILNPLN